jgi:sporulation integral membrane protein YtvI
LFARLFSAMLDPLVRVATKGFQRLRLGRGAATQLGMLILFGLVAILLSLGVNRLWHEVQNLARIIPGWVTGTAIPWIQDAQDQYRGMLPPYLADMIDNAIRSLQQTLPGEAASLSRTITSGAWSAATSIVDVILSIVLTIMGTYYLTADRGRIAAFFHRTFPRTVIRQGDLITKNLMHSLFGQVKSQLTVSGIVITFLVVSFLLFRVPYGLLAGLVIGIADALPVIGAGLFLISWSVLSFVMGDVHTGVLMAGIYIGTIVIRQLFEPRIVGKNLGLYPLATMIAMYAGYKAFGFLGLIGGPVMLNLLKVVLEADHYGEGRTPSSATKGGEHRSGTGEGQSPSSTEKKPDMKNPDGEITLPGGKKRPFKIKAK